MEGAPLEASCNMDEESLDSIPIALHSDRFMVGPSKTKEEETLWTNKVRKILNSEHPVEKPDGPCTIFKVPEHIRQLDPKAYTPKVVPLGPFHHHNPYKSSVMTHFKWRCVRHLLWRRHGSRVVHATQLLDKCLLELKKHDKKVRSCYLGELPARLDAEEMALIMLLDGCFVIFLMLKLHKVIGTKKGKGIEEVVEKLEDKTSEEDEGKKRRECEIENGEEEVVLNIQEEDGQLEYYRATVPRSTFNLFRFDLLKLENQIPFFIIQLLFDQLKTQSDGNKDLVDRALEFFEDIHPKESRSFKKQSPSEYDHLFHLFYRSRIPSEMSTENIPAAGCISIAMEHIFSRWKKKEASPSPTTWASSLRWTPNATELDRAGVKFRRKEPADSFLNITFGWRRKITPLPSLAKFCLIFKSGRMEIPPLQIYSYTGHLFRNLQAFEQCSYDTEMYFTTYTKFMDCIIDQAEDVRLLCFEGILEHRMKNDQALAELFNQLGSQIHFSRKSKYVTNQIGEVITNLNEFYEYKWHRWLAGLRRDYLSSPWAIISVLAAMVLLSLTIEQATFSALSYFHSS